MFHFEGIRLAYVLSGFGVGFLVGMTGVGGGSLMTPGMLPLASRVTIRQSIVLLKPWTSEPPVLVIEA